MQFAHFGVTAGLEAKCFTPGPSRAFFPAKSLSRSGNMTGRALLKVVHGVCQRFAVKRHKNQRVRVHGP